jgi:hypothetical protein
MNGVQVRIDAAGCAPTHLLAHAHGRHSIMLIPDFSAIDVVLTGTTAELTKVARAILAVVDEQVAEMRRLAQIDTFVPRQKVRLASEAAADVPARPDPYAELAAHQLHARGER